MIYTKHITAWSSLLAALVLVVAASVASAGNGNGGGNSAPLAPNLAQAAVDAPGAFGTLSVRPATLAEVQAAAAMPGAVTVGNVPVTKPAGGATIGIQTPASVVTAATQWGCNAVAGNHYWGTPPYEQDLYQTVYWCAYYGQQLTSVTSSPSAGSTWLCGTDWTSQATVSGGVGYSWATKRASAGWGCPTVIPWVTIHTSHWFDINVNSWGSSSYGGSG